MRTGKGKKMGDWLQRGAVWSLPCLLGMLVFFYVRIATVDVVYSDYIRLINTYLPNPLAPEHFFTGDVFTRIPATYVFRWLNLRLFDYSVAMDRMAGILGLVAAAWCVGAYCERRKTGIIVYIPVLLFMFSLNKWEMLINGSGYIHFLTYALFFWTFYLLDKLYNGTAGRKTVGALVLLPAAALLTGGPYIICYCAVILAAVLWLCFSGQKNVGKRDAFYIGLSAAAVLFVYMISNAAAVYELSGAEDITLMELITGAPAFIVHFFLNGFASEIVEGSILDNMVSAGRLEMRQVYLLGALCCLMYAAAVWSYFRTGLYRQTLFPMLMLLSGIGSHIMVFLSRYVFLQETYAWQSRYALQYMPGMIGVFLIYGGLYGSWKNRNTGIRTGRRTGCFIWICGMLTVLAVLCGNVVTTRYELEIAPYRRLYFEHIRETALHYHTVDDEVLNNTFEYHHGPDKVRAALRILEENKLNVFSE